MRVLSLNFGDAQCASSQFRIHAYAEPLAALGIQLESVEADGFQDWDRLAAYDAVIVQKKLLPLDCVRAVRRHARSLFYDIDDAIWQPHGRRHHFLTRLRTNLRLRSVVRSADRCLAANEVIASHLRRWSPRVTVFPMALDARTWKCVAKPGSDQVVLGWSGAPGNLPYLEALEPALLEICHRHPETVVRVLCGKAPGFRELRAEHVPWRPGVEPETVASFDIGLLPLQDSPFAAAKSPIKGLQYLACGIPAVATPLAATRELFLQGRAATFASTPSEWIHELDALVALPQLRLERGAAGRAAFEQHHSLQAQAAVFARLLSGTSGEPTP